MWWTIRSHLQCTNYMFVHVDQKFLTLCGQQDCERKYKTPGLYKRNSCMTPKVEISQYARTSIFTKFKTLTNVWEVEIATCTTCNLAPQALPSAWSDLACMSCWCLALLDYRLQLPDLEIEQTHTGRVEQVLATPMLLRYLEPMYDCCRALVEHL